jgi:hypothetical protein
MEKILEEDQINHPQCNYSVSKSSKCSNEDGKIICEVFDSINRLCPNKKPMTIYSNVVKTNEPVSDTFGIPNNFGSTFIAPFFGDILDYDFHSNHKKNRTIVIPHEQPRKNKFEKFSEKNNVRENILRGEINGSVEEI